MEDYLQSPALLFHRILVDSHKLDSRLRVDRYFETTVFIFFIGFCGSDDNDDDGEK